MYKKLSFLLITVTILALSLSRVPQAKANTSLHFTLQQLILTEIQRMQQHIFSQIAQISITQGVVTPTPTPTINTISNTPTGSGQPTTASSTTPTEVRNYIMNAINSYRASQGLSSVQTSNETCNFAQIRAQEISTGFNHDGFTQRVNNHTLPYKSWSQVTENIAETPNYKNVVTLWENSPGHAANMRANTPYVCVAQYQNYYAYEGLRL